MSAPGYNRQAARRKRNEARYRRPREIAHAYGEISVLLVNRGALCNRSHPVVPDRTTKEWRQTNHSLKPADRATRRRWLRRK